jgi:hypothetical protein
MVGDILIYHRRSKRKRRKIRKRGKMNNSG